MDFLADQSIHTLLPWGLQAPCGCGPWIMGCRLETKELLATIHVDLTIRKDTTPDPPDFQSGLS